MVRIVEPSVEIISDIDGTKILKHLEKCARNCYRSEGLISEDDSSARKMIQKLLELEHTAMIEHYSLTFRLVCDVGVYKDLTRHRHCSWAIESTRYCNYSKNKFDNNINIIKPVNIKERTPEYDEWYQAMLDMEKHYMKMAELGCKPDQLRMLLPHSTAASVFCTCNIRELRHIFNLRCAPAAHPSVRQVILLLLDKIHKEIPVLFDDIFDKYKTDIEEFKKL